MTQTANAVEAPRAAKLAFWTLTSMVVGSMVGAGVFEQGRRLFSPGEAVLPAVSIVGAVIGVVALAAGWISI